MAKTFLRTVIRKKNNLSERTWTLAAPNEMELN